MALLKDKCGARIAAIMANGKTTKNMDLVFNITKIKTAMRAIGKITCDMAKVIVVNSNFNIQIFNINN